MRHPFGILCALALALAVTACGDDGGSGEPIDASPAGPDASTTPPDPLALGAEVSQAELTTSIQALEDLGTRFTYSDGDEAARDYLVGRLEAYGLSTELDTFPLGAESAANVIARKPGTTDPEGVFIFSAHYDSISGEPDTNAPGADDNASGVAAVLEAARILGPHAFRYSLWFVFTAAEEQGSLGSAHMVDWLATQGIDVRGVIAPDMIAYWPLGEADAMDILGDTASTDLVNRMATVATAMGVAHKTWIQHDYCYGDDHTNFQRAGYPAITPMDCVEAHNLPMSGESTPHYHQPTDTIGTLHLPFTTRVAGVIVATLAELGEPVAP